MNKGKEVWKVIREMENSSFDNKDTLAKLELEGRGVMVDKKEMADEINTYISIGDGKIGSACDAMKTFGGIGDGVRGQNGHSYFSQPVPTQTVINILDSFETKMTCGPDGIPVAIIKKVIHQIAEPLTQIINRSIQLEKCPERLKDTKVIAIQKDKTSHKLNDLRPLAITSVFSKVMETVHYNGMSQFLTKNELLSKHQHGYTKGRSCETAILDLTMKVHTSLSAGKEVVVLFLDLTKAFNCVDADTLIAKCNEYGFRGKFSNWVE